MSGRRRLLISLVFAGCVEQGADPTPGPLSAGPPPGPPDATTGDTGTGDPADASTSDATTAEPDNFTTSGAIVDVSTGEFEGSSTGDETTTTDATGSTGSTGEPGGPSFSKDIWPIVFPECGCHVDTNGAGGLYLGKLVAYDNLVGQPSDQADMSLVDPGSPDTSYVWHKLKGTHDDVGGEGKLMPPGGSLDVDQLDLIRAWIEQGAQP